MAKVKLSYSVFLPMFLLCTDTCQGDSGGPLMAFVNNHWILVGLTSSGVGCARAGYLGLYTRVSAFVSFIESNVNRSIFVSTTASTTSSTRESSSLKNNSFRDIYNISVDVSTNNNFGSNFNLSNRFIHKNISGDNYN